MSVFLIFALLFGAMPQARAVDEQTQQRALADAFVAALIAQDAATLKALTHPSELACISNDNRDYFDFGVEDDLQTGAMLSSTYSIASIVSLTEPAPLMALPADGFTYPVPPTHRVQINAQTRDGHPMVLLRFIAAADGKWYVVEPCPNDKGMAFFRQERAEGDKQRAEAKALAAQLSAPLRAELKQLLAEDRWIDAANRYREATGADLATAAGVVDVIKEER